MKFQKAILVIMLLFCLSGCASTSNKEVSNPSLFNVLNAKPNEIFQEARPEMFELVFEELKGTWLRDEYIDNIKTQKYLFSDGIDLYRLIFSKEDNTYTWFVGYGDEGLGGRIIGFKKSDIAGMYNVIVEGEITPELSFRIHNNSISQIEVYESSFSKIDCSEDQFINKYTLEGTYKDEKGFKYKFDKNLVAKWPNKEFKYTLKDSYWSSGFNIITEVTEGICEHYAYEFKDNKLYIYHAFEDGVGINSEKEPLFVLSKDN